MSIRAETPMLVHTIHAYNITVSDEGSNDFNKYFVRNSNAPYICTHALCWSNTLFGVIWKYRVLQLCTYEGSKM